MTTRNETWRKLPQETKDSLKRRMEALWSKPGTLCSVRINRIHTPGYNHGGYELPKDKSDEDL